MGTVAKLGINQPSSSTSSTASPRASTSRRASGWSEHPEGAPKTKDNKDRDRDKDKDRERDRDKDKDKDREKEKGARSNFASGVRLKESFRFCCGLSGAGGEGDNDSETRGGLYAVPGFPSFLCWWWATPFPRSYRSSASDLCTYVYAFELCAILCCVGYLFLSINTFRKYFLRWCIFFFPVQGIVE